MSITRTKECRTCGKHEPRGWTEASLYQCNECKNEINRSIRKTIAHGLVNQTREQAEASRRRLDPLIDSLTSPQAAAQMQALKAAQYKPDPRSVAMARQMAHDTRPASRGTQQDPGVDPVLAILTYDALTTNDRADWDSSSHRQYEASSVSSASSCDDSGSSYHHTSHDSGSSYDSGSDSSSYSSGGCD